MNSYRDCRLTCCTVHVWYVCVTEWLKPIARTSGPLDHEVLRFISWFGKFEFWVRFRVCFGTLPSLSAHHHLDWSLFGPWWQDRAFSEDTSTTEAASELHAEARRESFMATMYSHGVWGYHILKKILNQGTISTFSLVSISDWSLSTCFFCSRDDLFSFGWCP